MNPCWRRLSFGHPEGEAWRLTGRAQGTDRSEERHTSSIGVSLRKPWEPPYRHLDVSTGVRNAGSTGTGTSTSKHKHQHQHQHQQSHYRNDAGHLPAAAVDGS
jgi:hypothetical protein